jgi:cytochrome c oxidase subunit I+III
MLCLMLVSGTTYACQIWTYLFLWLVNGDTMWPPPGMGRPVAKWGAVALGFYATSGGVLLLGSVALRRRDALPVLLMPVAFLLLAAGFAADLMALWQAGLRPALHAHAAASYALLVWQGTHVAVAAVMAGYLTARCWAGMLDGTRRVSFDNVMLFWLYTVGQGVVGLALLHGFPWLLA